MLVLCYHNISWSILCFSRSLPFIFNFTNIFFTSLQCLAGFMKLFTFITGKTVWACFLRFFYLFLLLNYHETKRSDWLDLFFQCFSKEKNRKNWYRFKFHSRGTEHNFFQSHDVKFRMRMLIEFFYLFHSCPRKILNKWKAAFIDFDPYEF